MADYKNIPLGLRTQTQIPLDVKEYIQNESLLSNLGVNGQLAYTYTKGLVVYCIEESTRWEWTEVKPGLEDTGLINQDFIYSDNHIAFGIDYSNKRYNFVKVISGSETKINAGTNVTVTGNGTDATPYIINSSGGVTVNDATSSIKGILRLTGDLGGTADLPTTPTAIHKTGNETIAGLKQVINSLANTSRFIFVTNADATTPALTTVTQSATQAAIDASSTSSSGTAISASVISGGAKGVSITSNLIGAGGTSSTMLSMDNILVNNDITPIRIKKQGTDVLITDHLGNITASSFIKTGGTEQQLLLANGNVSELNPQKTITTSYTLTDIDNNYTVFVNNGATPVTITIDSNITLPNFCVGFIQEGTGDVTFVGTGVSLTNPVGLKSKGQGYQTFIERKLGTSNYFLLGNTRA